MDQSIAPKWRGKAQAIRARPHPENAAASQNIDMPPSHIDQKLEVSKLWSRKTPLCFFHEMGGYLYYKIFQGAVNRESK